MGMTMPGGSADDDVMMDINTTPLIDVMLVLLIMLIITIPVQTHAVKLDLPVAAPQTPSQPPPVIEVGVDFDGTITWNGEVVPDRSSLEDHLREVAAMADQTDVHIRPDRLTSYKFVAEVLASAQRLGVTKIGLVGSEDSSP